ncbi:YidH family protein [Trichothermofontia sp.]
MLPLPSPPDPNPYNLANELAKERTRAAADRTLMAWIRTALSLIGFGFGIPTIVKTIEATRLGDRISFHPWANGIGLLFISIGIFAMAAALKEHRQIVARIQSDRYVYSSSNTAEYVGIALLAVGVLSFLGIFLKALGR